MTNFDNAKAAVVSICSRKYLPQALVMVTSLRELSSDFLFHLFLTDITKIDGKSLIVDFPEIIFSFLDDYVDVHILDNLLLLSDIEFNTSLKPIALEEVIKKYNLPTFYCDSDLLFIEPLTEAMKMLSQYDVLLTPHQHRFASDDADFAMLRNGVFNAGFVGVSGSRGLGFISWWKEKTRNYCVLEPEEGLFVDQKWLDLVPALFEGVCVWRHPGCNYAYWNFMHKPVDVPVVFYHLSGFDLSHPPTAGCPLSKYSSIPTPETLIPLLTLYQQQYTDLAVKIDKCIPSPTSVGRIAKKMPMVERRYMVKYRCLDLENNHLVLRSRPRSRKFHFSRFGRRESRYLFIPRVLGQFLVSLKLGVVVELLLNGFRLLSRRSNWLL